MLGQLDGVLDVLLDEQDREALPVELAHHAVEPEHHCRREPERRLVEHEQARPRHQPSRDREHLALPAAQRARGALEPLAEDRKQREHLGPGRVRPRAGAGRVRAHRQVLPSGKASIPAPVTGCHLASAASGRRDALRREFARVALRRAARQRREHDADGFARRVGPAEGPC